MIIVISLVITLVYLIFIARLIFGFDRLGTFRLSDQKPSAAFSIVIPFRNEAKNLPKLLNCLKRLNYPTSLFEVLLINDESTDDSVSVIHSFQEKSSLNVNILDSIRTTGSPKKDAISLGIGNSKFDWIITTDADCEMTPYWLDAFDDYICKTNPKMVLAPIIYKNSSNFLERFQSLDVLSLQGATIGAFGIGKPFLCNGANMAYSKKLFYKLDGFKGNDTIASGDDIFLLEKALKLDKASIGYLKNEHAIVNTMAEPTWSRLTDQRLRWAAKTSKYTNTFGKLVALIILLMNALVICCIPLTLAGIISLKFAFYVLIIKLSIDFLLIYKAARFFNQETLLGSYLFAGLLYPFFSVYIAILSVFKDYKWKGRQFSK